VHSPYSLLTKHSVLAACFAPHCAFQGHAAHSREHPLLLNPKGLSCTWDTGQNYESVLIRSFLRATSWRTIDCFFTNRLLIT
jgi:hypothetical protein